MPETLAGPAAPSRTEILADLLERTGASPTLEALLGDLRDSIEGQEPGHPPLRPQVAGLAGSALSLVVAHVYRQLRRTVCVVTEGVPEAEALRDDLEGLVGAERALYLPEFESSPYDVRSPHVSILDARQTTLSRLAMGHEAVVVTTVAAVATAVPSPPVMRRGTMTLTVGDPMDADDLAEWLVGLAYHQVPNAEAHGDFARRGSILDVYTFGYANPLRLEFDEDEVASIREYDPATQRSVVRHEQVTLVPRREMVVDDAAAIEAAKVLRETDAQDAEALAVQLETEAYFVDMQRIAGYIDQEWGSVLRYLPSNVIVLTHRPRRFEARVDAQKAGLETGYASRQSHRQAASPPETLLVPWESIATALREAPGADIDPVVRTQVRLDVELPEGLRHLNLVGDAGDPAEDAGDDVGEGSESAVGTPLGRGPRHHFRTAPQESFGRSMEALREFLAAQAAAKNHTVILCDNPGQRDRLRELIVSDDEAAVVDGAQPGALPAIDIVVGQLSGGFTWREVRLAVLTDHEIFARFRRKRSRRRRFKAGLSIPSLTALKPGDHVVHIDYGIGVYRRTERLTIDGHETDCLELHYQRGDKLFIPVDQFDLIQRYAVDEGSKAPPLSRIGGTQWAKTKAKAQKAIDDISEELLKMQAIRTGRSGFACEPDNVWQRQLESSFLYEDTPDQAKATADIKEDMEAARPMDRLICGDVGFGKTEVAVRAAFKAVQSGKQVGVLVPTTILASQHHDTFSDRLGEFPLKVELLSRFRTTAEQRQVVAGVKAGEVDIVIGTHRLLQKDVEFKELGLIIVDEEQRFGVRHKERLKQLKELADVLTLTATPIPRTMHQALLGTRDISLITTPPRDRVPVMTEIVEFDRDLIADALLRETDRGGQSFFVHNRVQSIDATARFLRRFCPQLRFGIAHGQMSERGLEQVIIDFVDRKYDVLVTTMIIESGIDMPTVNTLLVNRADRFGLGQLYQLRGRVGRSNQRAYCYLMVPPHRALTETAEKRLRAIEEYNDLGSGIKVAMKDLEIRGAGNILGSQQHGHMAAVGYDLYCRMLEETMRDLKGDGVSHVDTRVTTTLDAYLSDHYVDSEDKIDFYKRLAETRDIAQVDELRAELEDRFGRADEAAQNIFELRRIKLMAGAVGLEEVDVSESKIRFEFHRQPTKSQVAGFMQETDQHLEFSSGERFTVRATRFKGEPLTTTRHLLEALARADDQTEEPN